MTDFRNFKGQAKRIENIDLPRVGHIIGVGEDKIHAILDVESAGRGFDSSGRPKMLFEPHIFHRELSGANRAAAVAAGLAYPKWKPGAYPSDSYPRLERALAIDETAALRSASWGLGQIMGFNHKPAGYASPQAMVLSFLEDEDDHLEAMIAFIVARGLDDDLRRGDYRGFAYGYNGAGYAKHGYHLKLERAEAKWKKIPDTPWDPDAIAAAWEADDTPVYDADPAPAQEESAEPIAEPVPAPIPEPIAEPVLESDEDDTPGDQPELWTSPDDVARRRLVGGALFVGIVLASLIAFFIFRS